MSHTTVRFTEFAVDGARLTVSTAGPSGTDGANGVVVLVHGAAQIGYSWRHQIRPLAAAGWRVLAPDLRGCGWSPVTGPGAAFDAGSVGGDIVTMIESEGIDPVVLVGQGFGCDVVRAASRTLGGRVAGLVAVSPGREPFDRMLRIDEEVHGVDEARRRVRIDPYTALRRTFWSGSAEAGSSPDVPAGLPPHLQPAEFENYFRAYARSGFDASFGFVDQRRLGDRAAAPGTAHDLPTRTLVVTSGADAQTNASADEVASSVDSMHVSIDGHGHWLPEEAPDSVTEALLHFCGSALA